MKKRNEIERMLGDRNLTRREFLGYTSAMGISVAAAGTLWSGHALANMPKRGGHLRCGLNDANTIDSLDSTQYNATTMIVVSRSIRDSIVDVGVDGSPTPNLAESWEASPDAKVWRFKIRKGVEFSNGKTLTIEDVVNSINVHRGEDTKSAAKGVFAGISDVRTEGDDTVVVEVTDANADLPFLFTDYHFSVVPTVDGKADLHSPHGTGCYLLREFEPGVRTALAKNPNAWQGGELGFADSVEILAILDDTSRVNALVSGSVDVINRPRSQDHRAPEARAGRADRRRAEQPRVHPPDAHERGAVRQQRLPPGAQVLDAAPGVRRQDHLRLRHHRQRSAPRSAVPELRPESERPLRSRQGEAPSQEVGARGREVRHEPSDTAYGGAVLAAQLFAEHWQKIGPRAEHRARAQGRLLERGLEQEAVLQLLLGTAPGRGSDPLHRLPVRLAVERHRDQHPARGRAGGQGARRARPGEAHRDVPEVQQLLSAEGGTLIPAFGSDVAAASSKVGVPEKIGGGWEMDGGHFVKRCG